MLVSTAVLAQSFPQRDLMGADVGQSCPASASWINTTINQVGGISSQGLQTVTLTNATGVAQGNWLTVDAGAAPVQVLGENVIAVTPASQTTPDAGQQPDNTRTHFTFTLLRGSVLPNTMKVYVNGVLEGTDSNGIIVGSGMYAAPISGPVVQPDGYVPYWDSYWTTYYASPTVASPHSAVLAYVDVTFSSAPPAGASITVDYKYTPAEFFLVTAVAGNNVTGWFVNTHSNGATVTQGTWYRAKITISGTPTWVLCSPLGFAEKAISMQTFDFDSDTSHIDYNFSTAAAQVNGVSSVGITTVPASYTITPTNPAGICRAGTGCVIQIDRGNSTQMERVLVTASNSTTFTATFTKTHAAGFPIDGGGVADTSSPTAVTVTGSQVITPVSMLGICDQTQSRGCVLTIDQGQATEEHVAVMASTATTFTANFTKLHAANFQIRGYVYPSVICGKATTNGSNSCADNAGGMFNGPKVWGPLEWVRFKGYGFNWGGVVDSTTTQPLTINAGGTGTAKWPTPDNSQPQKVPFIRWIRASLYAQFDNLNYAKPSTSPGCTGLYPGSGDFAVKDIEFGVARFNLTNKGAFIAGTPDTYDPNYAAWQCGAIVSSYAPQSNGTAGIETPWQIPQFDETDDIKGFNRGPDFPNLNNSGAEDDYGWRLLSTPYHISANGTPMQGAISTTKVAYADNLNHTKDTLRTYLCCGGSSLYATIGALNGAWGSSYTTAGTSGTQTTGIALSTTDHLTYAGTLPTGTPIDKNSIQIFGTGNVILAGDAPATTSTGWTGTGTFFGDVKDGINVSTSSINYTTGAISVTFSTSQLANEPLSASVWNNGWCNGTGLMDECGQHTWIGSVSEDITKDGTAAFQNDIEGFLGKWAKDYATTQVAVSHAVLPHTLVQGHYAMGSQGQPARAVIYKNQCPVYDVIGESNSPADLRGNLPVVGRATTPATLPGGATVNAFDWIDYWCVDNAANVGLAGHSVPITYWMGADANADSPMENFPRPANRPVVQGTTQVINGQTFLGKATMGGNWVGGLDYTGAFSGEKSGAEAWWFQLVDQIQGTSHVDWGWETLAFNLLDGKGIQCTPSATTFTIGNATFGRMPENRCYGDFVDPMTTAISVAQNKVIGVVTPTAPQPTFAPPAGSYNGGQAVVMSCAVASPTVFYTTDGSTPTESSSCFSSNTGTSCSAGYGTPLAVNVTTTVQALCNATGFTDSPVATAGYTIAGSQADTPTFSPTGGPQPGATTVTISDASPGVSIYYTTDGTTPTTNSLKYSAPFLLVQSATVKSIASGNGFTTSSVGSVSYQINPAPIQNQKKPTAVGVAH